MSITSNKNTAFLLQQLFDAGIRAADAAKSIDHIASMDLSELGISDTDKRIIYTHARSQLKAVESIMKHEIGKLEDKGINDATAKYHELDGSGITEMGPALPGATQSSEAVS